MKNEQTNKLNDGGMNQSINQSIDQQQQQQKEWTYWYINKTNKYVQCSSFYTNGEVKTNKLHMIDKNVYIFAVFVFIQL